MFAFTPHSSSAHRSQRSEIARFAHEPVAIPSMRVACQDAHGALMHSSSVCELSSCAADNPNWFSAASAVAPLTSVGCLHQSVVLTQGNRSFAACTCRACTCFDINNSPASDLFLRGADLHAQVRLLQHTQQRWQRSRVVQSCVHSVLSCHMKLLRPGRCSLVPRLQALDRRCFLAVWHKHSCAEHHMSEQAQCSHPPLRR